MANKKPSGWYLEWLRHHNARVLGRAGGVYASDRNKKFLKSLSYKQLKNLGVKLSPRGDADKDGAPNAKDRRPLDPDEQDLMEDIKGGLGKTAKFVGKEAKEIKEKAIAAEKAVAEKAKEEYGKAEKFIEKKAIPFAKKELKAAEKFAGKQIEKEEKMRKAAAKEIKEIEKENIEAFAKGVKTGIKDVSRKAGESIPEGTAYGVDKFKEATEDVLKTEAEGSLKGIGEYIKEVGETIGGEKQRPSQKLMGEPLEIAQEKLEEAEEGVRNYAGFGQASRRETTDEYKRELEEAEREGQLYDDEKEYLTDLRRVRLQEKRKELDDEVYRQEHPEEFGAVGRKKPKSLFGAFEDLFSEGLEQVGELPEPKAEKAEQERMVREVSEAAGVMPCKTSKKELLFKIPVGDIDIETEEGD